MSIEELDIDMGRFGDFDQLDLLDLVEGTMSPDRAKVLVETVREKDPELLHMLVRMQADRIEMSSHHTPPTPENLLAKIQQFNSPHDILVSDFPEAIEPTLMMERSLKNLGKSRRRRQRAPMLAAVAACLAGVGVTTVALIVLDIVTEPEGLKTVAPVIALDSPADTADTLAASVVSESTAPILTSASTIPQNLAQKTTDPNNSSFVASPVVAENGLVLQGVDPQAIGIQLSAILSSRDMVLVENIPFQEMYEESLSSAADGSFRNRRQMDRFKTGAGVLQPPPMVGFEDGAPSNATRSELAERGFRWAIVLEPSQAEDVIARIERLAETVELVPMGMSGNSSLNEDVRTAWNSRKEAIAEWANADRLVIPISCVGAPE